MGHVGEGYVHMDVDFAWSIGHGRGISNHCVWRSENVQ